MKVSLIHLTCRVLVLLALCCEPGCLLYAQAAVANNNDDEVRGVIVLARHGVRAPIESETRGGAYNAWAIETLGAPGYVGFGGDLRRSSDGLPFGSDHKHPRKALLAFSER